MQSLTNEVLTRLETEHNQSAKSLGVPERVKQLRQHLIASFEKSREGTATVETRRHVGRIVHGMEELFFAIQLYSYRGDYLVGVPSIERIAETVDKLEEDLLDRDLPGLRGRRRVIVEFGEPIVVPTKKIGRDQVAEFTMRVQGAVQTIVDQLSAIAQKP